MATRIEIGDRSITTDEIQDLLATDHPMVAQFRFEATQRSRDALHFALHILPRGGVRYRQQRDARGQRVKPTRKRLSGHEEIGQGNRAIWLEGDELVAENCTFFPNQAFNDLGIGSALYVSMERLYRQLGIRRVTLLAVDVGVYVWARQAFAFAEHRTARGMVGDLQRFVRSHADDSAADAEIELDPAGFEHSWDLANYDRPPLIIDGYRPGKAFMLHRAPPWSGIRDLDDPRHNAVAEASRRETFARLPEKIEGAPETLDVR